MQKGQIEVKKIDSENGEKPLANAEFDIVKDGVVVEHIVTDKDGKAISKPLAPGKYILKETKAPEGCQLKSRVRSKCNRGRHIPNTSGKCNGRQKVI